MYINSSGGALTFQRKEIDGRIKGVITHLEKCVCNKQIQGGDEWLC